MPELDRIMTVAVADASSSRARNSWRGDLAVTYKTDSSSLTEADLSIEEMWRERIRRDFPSHGILGEEFGSDAGASA
ncbi:inositol monophosphatase family protein [Mesorhizobium sp.]|uniref:inositol monophosphatase family protein n=1 Tax=Mesorhizobium sp. TaxID=1871066 RepID=UPI000FEA1942|nr:inositol monophosphatase family protein [Mesorhizobium sp.]RWK26990.1 MAG: hypothetical protein EOR44_29395 [Mesorhizobium sp.]